MHTYELLQSDLITVTRLAMCCSAHKNTEYDILPSLQIKSRCPLCTYQIQPQKNPQFLFTTSVVPKPLKCHCFYDGAKMIIFV